MTIYLSVNGFIFRQKFVHKILDAFWKEKRKRIKGGKVSKLLCKNNKRIKKQGVIKNAKLKWIHKFYHPQNKKSIMKNKIKINSPAS